MLEYFEGQLRSAESYNEKDMMENIELRSSLYSVEGLQKYSQYFYEHLGQRILYFFVRGGDSYPLNIGMIVKCFEDEVERYRDCLEYNGTLSNDVYPKFIIKDMESYNKLRNEFGH